MKKFLRIPVLFLLGVIASAMAICGINYSQDCETGDGIVADAAIGGIDLEHLPLHAIEGPAGTISAAYRHILIQKNKHSTGYRVTNSKRQSSRNFRFSGNWLPEKENSPQKNYTVFSAVFCRGIFSSEKRIHFLRILII